MNGPRYEMEVVAVIASIRPAINSEALHTVVIEQYRPPVGTYVVGKNVQLYQTLVTRVLIFYDVG